MMHESARSQTVLTRSTELSEPWLQTFKIEDSPTEPGHIVTVRGVGYRFIG